MSTVIGIDPGYANFAFAVIPLHNVRQIVVWKRERLWSGDGKPSENTLFWAMLAWCRRNTALLEQATAIVIESQMQPRFKIMNTVVRTLYPDKTLVVHPNVVTAHYDMINVRSTKKQQAICWCRLLFDRKIPGGKADDMADAALMARMVADDILSNE